MDKELGPLVSGCIIDTNILIYHLAGVLTDQAEAILADALESGSCISIITRIELLGWRKHSPNSLKAAEALLQSVSEIPLHEEIIRLCISFRQNFPIKLPDAIIASTARYANVPLMTRNMTDFERVPELETIDPFS
ncbi:MAG: type II toxin-antitoxin system VapC family toxin [Syntrophaceae bacterium]|jgi:predicted nucleic acid-binding protein|nr:type II toxin-antitoxin system VapC family toxin [Syntrophaceae bacterium]